MADYPSAINSPRTKANRSGVVYDLTKETVIFAEDIQNDDDEIVAIETELGTLPKGAKANVKTRLDDVDTSLGLKVTNPMTAAGDIIVGGASGAPAKLAKGTDAQKLALASGTPAWVDDENSITFIIDGGGSAITTGQKGHLEIPFKCEIQRVTLLADASGSIVIDIWKDTYANFPPTDADSITSATPPTLAAAQKSQDATLTNWTKTINAGDILAFNVDSVATVTRVTLALKVKKVA